MVLVFFTAIAKAAAGQQATGPVIGFLSSRSQSDSASYLVAFRKGLAEAGFVEGRNLSIAFRWAENRYKHLPALASELVDLHVSLLVAAGGPPAALAAKAATSSIPIVFSAVGNPVELGLVASLGRPGGNVTGMGLFNPMLVAKQVEFMKELAPQATAFAVLLNPANPNMQAVLDNVTSTSNLLGVTVHTLKASTESEIDAAVAEAVRLGVVAMAVVGEPFLDSRRDQVIALSRQRSLAAIFAYREQVEAGGLMSYGTSLSDAYRRSGIYCGRILKGEKPSDLPVEQPTKFELVINLKTAKTLGLTIPSSLLQRADEVME
jgi:putative ABC transport system substrate-binding protein